MTTLQDSPTYRLFATAPKGMIELLAAELETLGAQNTTLRPAGVAFDGTLECAYRICLWSRLANRVLMPLAEFDAPDPEALYAGVREIDWALQLLPDGTLAVDFTSVNSAINHTRFGALKVKDAIVDEFRELCGERPSVDTRRPDLRVNVHLQRDRATVSLDLSGESLHRRGYRTEGAAAPLKENLAAAILIRGGWPEVAAAGGPLVDPMCGSGTLPIEAALIAGDVAPGLLRVYFGFLGWKGHDDALWQRLVAEAEARREAGLKNLPPIVGYDENPAAVRAALENLEHAELRGYVHIEKRELSEATPPPAAKGLPGLVAVNPPYGERLGEVEALGPLYAALGARLKREFLGWQAVIFTGNPDLGKRVGIKARRSNTMYNGAIECRLLRFDIEARWFVNVSPGKSLAEAGPPTSAHDPESWGEGARMFANRLRKNLRNLGRWARREGIDCYRLYDADIPEYALAVDLYGGDEGPWVHVQEYEAPRSVEREKARERLNEALSVLPAVLEIAPERIFFKVRRRQKGAAQYEKLEGGGDFYPVREYGAKLLVNFTDYLDTGLFLDHRLTRRLVGELAAGRHVLNLFCYTGSASVHAALGGAKSTTSVDMSNTYLEWAKRNLALNGFGEPKHTLIQADCLAWLEQAVRQGRQYGLIFLDPPTFSTSKRMRGTFDVQRDHVRLLRQAAKLLTADGVLIFSNNFRRFKMETDALPELTIEEITAQTIPPDFERNARIHNCWRIARGK